MGEAKRKNKQSESFQSKKNRTNVTMTIVILAIVIVIGLDVSRRMQNAPLTNFHPQRTVGMETAPLQILEFVDLQCPECRRGSDLIKKYRQLYPDGIRLSIKLFPLGELNSMMSAVYAECAGRQDKFWEFHDEAFAKQSEWRTLLRIKKFFDSMGQELGLNVEELQSCVEKDDVKKVVEKDKALGEAHFVKSTPTYFINGKMIVGVESLRSYLVDFFEKEQSF